MGPELGFVLILALLWGPTALWLAARVIRGQRARLAGPFNIDSDLAQASALAPHQPEAMTSEGFWVCSACRSINRREAKSCYSCRQDMHLEGRQPPKAVPGATPPSDVPVMAEVLAPAVVQPARARVVIAAPPPLAPARVRDPGLAAVPEVRKRDPRRKATVPRLEVLPADPVCPFLGFGDDPTTRCSFPDPRNRCHTPLEQSNGPLALPRRLIAGKASAMRTLEIGPEHQEALCLTAAHEQCARFPAIRVLEASR